MPETNIAVVLAAGIGARVGAEAPKQFLELDGIPVLVRTVNSLTWCDRVVVVHHPEYFDLTHDLLERAGLASNVMLVAGGATRRHSVAAALGAVGDAADDAAIVLQNAASPNTPRQLVESCLQGLTTHDVVQAYVPAVHTIFSHEGRELSEVLPRSSLGYSADPTVYRLGCLRRIASAQAEDPDAGDMTLDTTRLLAIPVLLIPSPETNVKLTTTSDLVVLQDLLASAHVGAAEVFRPWGSYRTTDCGDGFQTKRIIVNPGARLSLQKHRHRSEHWVVVSGTAEVTVGSEVRLLGENEFAYIPAGTVHRLGNPGQDPLHLIEVQCGSYLGEDDIVRLEDQYGRAGS